MKLTEYSDEVSSRLDYGRSNHDNLQYIPVLTPAGQFYKGYKPLTQFNT